MPTTSHYTVSGMTCGHCAGSVRAEVSSVDDVTSVDVNVITGALTVHGDQPVDSASVLAAVQTAGYSAEVTA